MQKVVILCPGMHKSQLTEGFLAGIQGCNPENVGGVQQLLIFPSQEYSAYSALHILNYLQRYITSENTSLTLIGFSAGVVGAIGAAWGWQMLGGTVNALVAVDGWGVPLYGRFPIYRLSHDYFTHWSSRLLGMGEDSFYADPPVAHLQLWRDPATVSGWWQVSDGNAQRTTASEFLTALLQRYCTNESQ